MVSTTTYFIICILDIKAAGVQLDDSTEPKEDPLPIEEKHSEQEQMEKQFERLGYPLQKTVIRKYQNVKVVHEKADIILAMSTVKGAMKCFNHQLLNLSL